MTLFGGAAGGATGGTAAGAETWLTIGLDTACRILRDEADEAHRLVRDASELGAMVAWESPSARGFQACVADLANQVDAAARLLEEVWAAAVGLRDQAVDAAMAVTGGGR